MKKTAADLVFARQGDGVRRLFAEHCAQRETTSMAAMGEFRVRRERFERWMENDFSDRATGEEGNIFVKSNETLGTVRSQIGFVVAKVQDELFGTAPFFAAEAEGEKAQDAELADKLFKWVNWKLRLAGWQGVALDVVERCFNLGEAILRTGWRCDKWTSYEMKTVLVRGRAPAAEEAEESAEGSDGPAEEQQEAEPVLTSSGEHITPEDKWGEIGEDGAFLDDGAGGEAAAGAGAAPAPVDGAAGGEVAGGESSASGDASAVGWERQDGASPGAVAAGRDARATATATPVGMALRKDPGVKWDAEGMRYEDVLVAKEETRYEGLDPKVIDWRNFRCPANYARIEDSDFRGHMYEIRWSELKRKMADLYGPEDEWDEETAKMVAELKSSGSDAKDETRKVGADASGGGPGDDKNPVIKCMDCEVEWDPTGEGNTAWFFATVLPDYDKVMWVDYLANVLPEGRSVYTVVSVYNPPNRWHGRGWWELYAYETRNIDKLWNILLHRDEMNANPIAGVHQSACVTDLRDQQPRPGWVIELKPDKKLADAVEFAVMPQADRGTWQILQFKITNQQLETGVTSAAQGGVGQLPATNTATGIQSVLSSGSTLVKRPTKDITMALEEALQKDVAWMCAYMDKEETFRYGEGENAVLVQMTPEDARDLEVKVRLLVTRGRTQERVNTARTAIGVVLEYIAVKEEDEKEAVRPLFVEVLRGLGVANADRAIRAVEPPPTEAPQPPVPQITVAFKDLPPVAKAQVLQKQFGIEVSPDDIAAAEAASKPQGKAPAAEPEAEPVQPKLEGAVA